MPAAPVSSLPSKPLHLTLLTEGSSSVHLTDYQFGQTAAELEETSGEYNGNTH